MPYAGLVGPVFPRLINKVLSCQFSILCLMLGGAKVSVAGLVDGHHEAML